MSEQYRRLWDGIPSSGPGTELKALLSSMGIQPESCGCEAYATQMDEWGIEWCRERRAEIVAHLQEQASKRGWAGKALAWLNPLDVFGSLVDEAIRRAEAKHNET